MDRQDVEELFSLKNLPENLRELLLFELLNLLNMSLIKNQNKTLIPPRENHAKRKIKLWVLKYMAFSFIFLLSRCTLNKVDKEEFLIPEGFNGYAVIIYGQKDGSPDSIVDKKIVYKIPKDGVLLVQGNQYLTNQLFSKYYYYSKDLRKTMICNSHNQKDTCVSMIRNDSAGEFQQDLNSERFVYTLLVIGKDSMSAGFDSSIIPSLINKKSNR